MSSASAALPDDVEALKRLVIGRDETIAKLLAEIARLKRWRFGRSAERMDQALLQLQLALDDLQRLPEVEPYTQAVLPLEESTQAYAIEREIRGRLPSERATVRQERSGPLLDELHAWLSVTLRTVSVKSPLAGAIHYALVRWRALTRYRDDGRIEIDNNSAERAIRPVVLGRRNYLFAGSDAGGERAANLYSLIGTAMLNAMDPYLYLRHVLERVGEHPINRIDELLPWHVAAKLPEAVRQAA